MFDLLARSLFTATRHQAPKDHRWGHDHWREAEMTGPFDERHRLSQREGGRG